MSATKAKLVQTVNFHATSKSRKVSKTFASVPGAACGARKTIEWSNERLQVYDLKLVLCSQYHFQEIDERQNT